MSTTVAVEHLQAKFKSRSLNYGDDWDKHVSHFFSVKDELCAKGQVFKNSEKIKNVLRTLPEGFLTH